MWKTRGVWCPSVVAVPPTSGCHGLFYRVSQFEHWVTVETWFQMETHQFRDFSMFLQCLRHSSEAGG